MRIHLKTSKNDALVPFNYHEGLVSAFHKWLGLNIIHDHISLYSLSWLNGGAAQKAGLNFYNGASWFISAHDLSILKQIIQGINKDPYIKYGMAVEEIVIQEEPSFKNQEKFILASPAFIKRTIEDRIKYFLYDDPSSSDLLTETFRHKLQKAALPYEEARVDFDITYSNPTTKLITYKGIKCKASLCPVIISGSPQQIAFAWNVGIGNSTGIGFGALK